MSVQEPLLVKLRRAQLKLALSALAIAGLTLTLISFLTLRAYVDQNLSLVAPLHRLHRTGGGRISGCCFCRGKYWP